MAKTWHEDDPKAALMTRKRKAIVGTARRHFLDSGYAESSVNRIAAEAGVSIKTLYRHFDNKDDLFQAVMEEVCAAETPAEPAPDSGAPLPRGRATPAEALNRLSAIGSAYLRHVLSADQLALYRVVTRDAHRFPELGRLYRAQVTDSRTNVVARHLATLARLFSWRIADPHAAATAFSGLLERELYDDALFGIRIPTDSEIATEAAAAAGILLGAISDRAFA